MNIRIDLQIKQVQEGRVPKEIKIDSNGEIQKEEGTEEVKEEVKEEKVEEKKSSM
jgi:hypothetical protein